MSILARYLNKQFFKFLGICHLVFVFLYLIIHFFDRVDNFAESHVAVGKMAAFFVSQIPLIAAQMLPPATLIAMIITFSFMERDNETIALRSCGISIIGLCKPVLAASCVLALFLFCLSEFVVPFASTFSNRIWRGDAQGQGHRNALTKTHTWYRGSQCIYNVPFFDNEKKLMLHPSLYFLDSSFSLQKKIDAGKAVWTGDGWELFNAIVLAADPSGGYSLKRHDTLRLTLPEPPEIFIMERREPEEMNLWELKAFAQAMQDEGYEANRYFVDFHIKIAFPFILIVFSLMAPPVALWKRRFSTPLAVCAGAGVCFTYILVLGISRAAGIAGVMPPVLSAWLANGIFSMLGIYLLIIKNR